MATRSNIGILRKDGKIEAVYSHYDGYPSGVGKTLRDHYTDKDKIEKLIDLGNVSSLEKNITKPEGHSMMNRIDGFTAFYGRDRGDEGQEAQIYDKLIELQYNDYTYIWDEEKGKWFFTDNYEDKSKRIDLATADLDKFAKGGKVKVYYMDDENKGSIFVSGPKGEPYEVDKETKYVMLDRDKADDIASQKDEWDTYLIDDKDKYDYKIRFLEKGGEIKPIEFTTQRGDREFYETYDRPSKDVKYGENEKDLIEEYYGEVLYEDDMGWWIDDDTVVTNVMRKEYAEGGKINELVFYQVEENEAGDGETYDNLDEAEMHWERLTDEQREEGTLMKLYWECEDGVCDITDTEIIYGKGGTLHKSIKHHYGLGGYLASGAIGAYLGAKNPTKVRKVTDPLDKAFSDIGKNFSDKKYAEGGDVEDKEYVLERYYVYVHKDDYKEGELKNVHNWDSSDYGDDDKTFSSKSALMDFIQEVVYRDTSVLTKNEDFSIDSDDDETTIDYSVLCKYNAIGRGYDYYSQATAEEIEQWKKGDLELFSVGFTFKVKVYETRKRVEFKEGGRLSWDEWTEFVDNLKEGDVVFNKETKKIGKVTHLGDKAFWDHTPYVLTDVDGYVSTTALEPYDERVHKNYKKFAEGGSVKDNKNAMITGGILGVLLGVFLNR